MDIKGLVVLDFFVTSFGRLHQDIKSLRDFIQCPPSANLKSIYSKLFENVIDTEFFDFHPQKLGNCGLKSLYL